MLTPHEKGGDYINILYIILTIRCVGGSFSALLVIFRPSHFLRCRQQLPDNLCPARKSANLEATWEFALFMYIHVRYIKYNILYYIIIKPWRDLKSCWGTLPLNFQTPGFKDLGRLLRALSGGHHGDLTVSGQPMEDRVLFCLFSWFSCRMLKYVKIC